MTRLVALALVFLAPAAQARSPKLGLGVAAGLDATHPLARVDVGFDFAFTPQWDGVARGSVGWMADDVFVFDMVAAARVRPLSPTSAWHVSFGALTGIHFGDAIRDYFGPYLATGFSLDGAHVWDLELQSALRVDPDRDTLAGMLVPELLLRLGCAL